MRPTLYAGDHDEGNHATILNRVLPLRCPHPDCKEGRIMVTGPCPDQKPYDNADGFEISCLVLHWVGADHNICDGRGFLYPDPPDWWERSSSGRVWIRQWEQHCTISWQAMGILEDSEYIGLQYSESG